MEIKVIITNVGREVVTLSDGIGNIINTANGNTFNVDFYYSVNGHRFESSTKIIYEGDPTFAELETMVTEKLGYQ